MSANPKLKSSVLSDSNLPQNKRVKSPISQRRVTIHLPLTTFVVISEKESTPNREPLSQRLAAKRATGHRSK